jgi:hypothetical protein
MASTASISILSTVTGLPEGGTDSLSIAASNSSAANTITYVQVTTAQGTATTFSMLSSAKFVLLIPPSTNTFPYRLTGSTAEVGLPLSSVDPAFLSLPGGTSFNVYTTAGTTFQLRVITY